MSIALTFLIVVRQTRNTYKAIVGSTAGRCYVALNKILKIRGYKNIKGQFRMIRRLKY